MKNPMMRIVLGLAWLVALPASTLAAPAKIGVLLKAKTPFWNAMEAGAIEAGKKLSVDVVVKAPASESDIAIQIQLLNALAAQNINALVIAPCSKESLAEPVAALKAKGVRIVVVDSALPENIADVFVGTDQRAAGQAAGKLLASLASEKTEIAFFKHNQTSGATEQREAGAMQKLREAWPQAVVHGDIYASTEKDVEAERAKLLLSKHPNTRAILASGTGGTMAMMRLLREREPKGAIKLVGFGFNLNAEVASAIQNGTMDGWIAQLPGQMGAMGVETATQLLAGQTPPPVVRTEFKVITKDNLADPAVQALLPAP